MTVYEKIVANHYLNQAEYPLPSKYNTKEAFREARKEHHQETYRLEAMFKADALDETGLTGHPKAEKAWALAWDRGHSSGLYEVLGNLQELADLLLD
jgi:hypothetical protein